MKIIVVYIGEILHCPPVLSIVQIFQKLKHEVILLTVGDRELQLQRYFESNKNLTIVFMNDNYSSKATKVEKYVRMIKIKNKLWKNIKNNYDENTIIWIVSEVSLKHLGKKILNYRYILHMLELIEGIYYISGFPLLKMNAHKYASNALAVIEAEYNRAHITKAWWNLTKLPFVLPNKPYEIPIEKKSKITSNMAIDILIKKLSDKKIILYQGNISKERPLDQFIEAVNELGNEYVFIMMLNGENPYPNLKSSNCYYIPFINPPFHLEITSHAYIGILSYIPVKNSYSILNTLYCAPNKVWEYSKFGVPMIGNDLPALKEMFDRNHNGICITYSKENIKRAILFIDLHYQDYARASFGFYNSVNLTKVCKDILGTINDE